MRETEQRRGRSIAMTVDECDAFLAEERTTRVATVDAAGRPHVTPLWFIWSGEALWLYSLTRSSRFTHLSRNPEIAAVVDAGESYDELRGVELRGRVQIVGDALRGPDSDANLADIEVAYAVKYRSGLALEHDGSHTWVALTPDRVVSWDFRKLAARNS